MSYRLVTLTDVKKQLVYDNDLSDQELRFRLDAVSQAIMDYIGNSVALAGWTDSGGLPLVDADGNPQNVDGGELVPSALDNEGQSIIPGPVRAATILALAAWDEDRKADLITPAVRSVLARFRDQAIA